MHRPHHRHVQAGRAGSSSTCRPAHLPVEMIGLPHDQPAASSPTTVSATATSTNWSGATRGRSSKRDRNAAERLPCTWHLASAPPGSMPPRWKTVAWAVPPRTFEASPVDVAERSPRRSTTSRTQVTVGLGCERRRDRPDHAPGRRSRSGGQAQTRSWPRPVRGPSDSTPGRRGIRPGQAPPIGSSSMRTPLLRQMLRRPSPTRHRLLGDVTGVDHDRGPSVLHCQAMLRCSMANARDAAPACWAIRWSARPDGEVEGQAGAGQPGVAPIGRRCSISPSVFAVCGADAHAARDLQARRYWSHPVVGFAGDQHLELLSTRPGAQVRPGTGLR